MECKWARVHLSRPRILLYLKNDAGKEALGEISPYPMLNRETCDEAFDELKKFSSILSNTKWTKEKLSLLNGLKPSVAFGIESALLQLLDPLPAFSCPFSALLQGSPDEILIQAEKAVRLGIQSAKLKLGHLSLKVSHALIAELRSQFHLRVDLNQKWKEEETLRFFGSYTEKDFDYIEDPLKDLDRLDRFPLPYALDFRPHFLKELQLPMKALIVKPSLVGNISKIQSLRKSIILSSCFDTGIGIFQIATLAKRLRLLPPQGLGPYLFLEKDLIEQHFPIVDGLIQIPEKISLQRAFYESLSHF